jgi:hypothetical protein
MPSMRAIHVAAMVLGGGLLYGCSRPDAAPTPPPKAALATERVTLIKSPLAPFLNELEDDEGAAEVERPGLALLVVRALPAMKWKAQMGEQIAEREGPMAEVKMAPGDGILYGWRSDLGDEIDMPTTEGICAQVVGNAAIPLAARQPRCKSMLRRFHLPSGTVVAYDPCATGPCTVAVVRNGVVSSIAVEGVTSARIVGGEGDGTLLLTSRWIRADGAWSGSGFVPVPLGNGPLVALPEIRLDEVDARDPKIASSRAVRVDITAGSDGAVVHLVGNLTVKSRDDGRELSKSSFDETHRVAVR